MAATYATMIAAFPEFSNTTSYPQTTIEFWLSQGYIQVSERLFRDSYDMAVMLWTAHHVAMGAANARAAARGGIPGSASGVQTSKSVDGVSVGYSTITSLNNAGAWNATSYGQRFLTMARSFATMQYVPGVRRQFL